MKKIIGYLCFMAFFHGMAMSAEPSRVLTMSTTTSTKASGLLDVLLPEFEKDTGIAVKVIAKGTGAAIRDGMDGNVDVIFVHARDREDAFVADGYGTKRYAVMHNDFVIAGPDRDPAGIRGMKDAKDAMARIAGRENMFVSRGDDSGTHTKEQELWRKSGVPMDTASTEITKNGKAVAVSCAVPRNGDKWYRSIGQGMGAALTFAEEKQAYLLTDRGTFYKYKYGRNQGIDLVILCEGDSGLMNPYGIIPVNPARFPHVRFDLAQTFAEWMVSQRGQILIRDYTLLGKPLFFPDAL